MFCLVIVLTPEKVSLLFLLDFAENFTFFKEKKNNFQNKYFM